jgi:glycine/D-amino acid oxidase-like deaminating enzyme
VVTSLGTLRAEIAIVATGASLPQLVSFCRFKIIGMRAQWLRTAASAARGSEPVAWSAARGHETYRWLGDGSVILSGSRHLPVQRELGARDGTTPEVQALLEDNLREIEPGTLAVVRARGAAIQSVSCDGLPLAGPVPGHPRLLVSGGFGTNTPGLALAAGEAIAELVRTGRAAHAAAFSPRRFL